MDVGKVHLITASRGLKGLVDIYRVRVDNSPRPESESAETVLEASAGKSDRA